jgi:hypothetical protein
MDLMWQFLLDAFVVVEEPMVRCARGTDGAIIFVHVWLVRKTEKWVQRKMVMLLKELLGKIS